MVARSTYPVEHTFEEWSRAVGHSEAAVEANWRARKQREWAELMSTGKPDSLTPMEVHPDDRDITRPAKNSLRPVSAWVRYGSEPVTVKGFAAMWTDEAMKVRWLTPKLEWHEAWVWIGAVTPRRMEHNELEMPRVGLSVNSPSAFDTPEARRAAGRGDR